MGPGAGIVRAVWAAVILLEIIGLVAAIHRLAALAAGATNGLDAGFAQRPSLTLAHILPGMLFMLLGPLQFASRLRSRYPSVHRWSGRVFVAAGYSIGASALPMGFRLAIGGANETAATTLFAIWFLVALTKAFLHARRRQFTAHREWMLRAFAIGLAVATIRPIVGVFFAFRRLSPQEFFGIAFWIGFTLHLILAEIWINVTRPAAVRARAA